MSMPKCLRKIKEYSEHLFIWVQSRRQTNNQYRSEYFTHFKILVLGLQICKQCLRIMDETGSILNYSGWLVFRSKLFLPQQMKLPELAELVTRQGTEILLSVFVLFCFCLKKGKNWKIGSLALPYPAPPPPTLVKLHLIWKTNKPYAPSRSSDCQSKRLFSRQEAEPSYSYVATWGVIALTQPSTELICRYVQILCIPGAFPARCSQSSLHRWHATSAFFSEICKKIKATWWGCWFFGPHLNMLFAH